MLDLKIKPEALQDLVKNFEYTTFRWGIAQAENYQDELFGGMQLLTNQESIGKVYPYADLIYRKLHI